MKAFDITSSGNLGACPLATVYYAGTAAEWEALGNTLGVNPSTEKQVELVCEYTGAMQPLPGPGPNPVQHITEVTYNRAEGYVHCKYNGTGSFYGIVFLNSKDFGLWDQVKETEETEDGGIQLYMDLLKNGRWQAGLHR